jgi:hypothetical protein
MEYELLYTGVFKDDPYFDIFVGTQAGEVLARLFQMLTAEHILRFVCFGPPSHDRHGSTGEQKAN